MLESDEWMTRRSILGARRAKDDVRACRGTIERWVMLRGDGGRYSPPLRLAPTADNGPTIDRKSSWRSGRTTRRFSRRPSCGRRISRTATSTRWVPWAWGILFLLAKRAGRLFPRFPYLRSFTVGSQGAGGCKVCFGAAKKYARRAWCKGRPASSFRRRLVGGCAEEFALAWVERAFCSPCLPYCFRSRGGRVLGSSAGSASRWWRLASERGRVCGMVIRRTSCRDRQVCSASLGKYGDPCVKRRELYEDYKEYLGPGE